MTDFNNPVLKYLDRCPHKNLFRDPSQVAKLQATVKSRLIECGYYLRAAVGYNDCICCSGSPTIDIPVLIYIPDIYQDLNRYRPQNWSPQVMPMYQVNIPTAEQLGINNGVLNVNVNINTNYNQVSNERIQTSYEPIQTNQRENNNMIGGLQPNQGGMMSGGLEPMQGGMMSGGIEPMQGGMMTNSSEPNNSQGVMMTSAFEPKQNF